MQSICHNYVRDWAWSWYGCVDMRMIAILKEPGYILYGWTRGIKTNLLATPTISTISDAGSFSAILKLDIRFVERLKVRLMGMVGGDAILKKIAKIWRLSLVESWKLGWLGWLYGWLVQWCWCNPENICHNYVGDWAWFWYGCMVVKARLSCMDEQEE